MFYTVSEPLACHKRAYFFLKLDMTGLLRYGLHKEISFLYAQGDSPESGKTEGLKLKNWKVSGFVYKL